LQQHARYTVRLASSAAVCNQRVEHLKCCDTQEQLTDSGTPQLLLLLPLLLLPLLLLPLLWAHVCDGRLQLRGARLHELLVLGGHHSHAHQAASRVHHLHIGPCKSSSKLRGQQDHRHDSARSSRQM
jgi:hypothetical protein